MKLEAGRTLDGAVAIFTPGDDGDCIAKFMTETAFEQPLNAEQNARNLVEAVYTLQNIVTQFQKQGSVSKGMIEQAEFTLQKLESIN